MTEIRIIREVLTNTKKSVLEKSEGNLIRKYIKAERL